MRAVRCSWKSPAHLRPMQPYGQERFWTLGWQCLLDMMPLFERLSQAIGVPEEGSSLDAMYRDMPAKNYSSGLLHRVPEQLAVVELIGVLRSDWGKPVRIAETLRRIDRPFHFPVHPFAPSR